MYVEICVWLDMTLFFFFWSILLRLLLLTSMYYYLGYNYVGTEVGPAEGPLGTPEVGGEYMP